MVWRGVTARATFQDARVLLLLCGAALLALSAPCRARATPTCVRTKVAEGIERPSEWSRAVATETTGRLAGSGDHCAIVSFTPTAERRVLVRATFMDEIRERELTLDDVSPALWPRVGGLAAADLVGELLAAKEITTTAAPTETAPTSGENAAPVASAIANISTNTKAETSPKSSHATRERPHRGHVGLGARYFFQHATPLARLEAGGLYGTTKRPWLRAAYGLAGEFAYQRSGSGRTTIGGVSLRLGVDVAFWRTTRASLWIGPSFDMGALMLRADPRGAGAVAHRLRAVSSACVRVGGAWRVSQRLNLTSALELGGVLRHLRVRSAQETLFAYEGAYLGLLLGVEILPRSVPTLAPTS